MNIPVITCCLKGLFLVGDGATIKNMGLVAGLTRAFCTLFLLVASNPGQAGLISTIKKIKPSVVGVGTLLRTRTPPAKLMGTGFVVSDGRHAVTNYHVVSQQLNSQKKETFAVFIGKGEGAEVRVARKVAVDKEHDLALLKFFGDRLPTVRLARERLAAEGQQCAFTGFPIGAALGLYPVTHRGIISAITPIATQVGNSKQLTAALISRLRDKFNVYQLDATAYPGNSGSPLYKMDSGEIIGILNMVFIKESKETVLEKPSGISYAIPVKYIHQLLRDNSL